MRHPVLRRHQRLDHLRVEHAPAAADLLQGAHQLLDVGDAFLQEVAEAGGAVLQEVVRVGLVRELRAGPRRRSAGARRGSASPRRCPRRCPWAACGCRSAPRRATRPPRPPAARPSWRRFPTISTSSRLRQQRGRPLADEVVILGEHDPQHGRMVHVEGSRGMTITSGPRRGQRAGARGRSGACWTPTTTSRSWAWPRTPRPCSPPPPSTCRTSSSPTSRCRLRSSSRGSTARTRSARSHPDTGVVVLSAHDDEAYALALLGGGHSGLAYLLKDRIAQGDELVRAIREVHAGGSAVDPLIAERLSGRSRHGRRRPGRPRHDVQGSGVRADGERARHDPRGRGSPRHRAVPTDGGRCRVGREPGRRRDEASARGGRGAVLDRRRAALVRSGAGGSPARRRPRCAAGGAGGHGVVQRYPRLLGDRGAARGPRDRRRRRAAPPGDGGGHRGARGHDRQVPGRRGDGHLRRARSAPRPRAHVRCAARSRCRHGRPS